MPSPKGGSSMALDSKVSTEKEYLEMLAKEFSSIPDREVPPPEPQEDDQASALTQTAKITTKPEKESIDSRNVAIAKTIRSAMADMQIKKS